MNLTYATPKNQHNSVAAATGPADVIQPTDTAARVRRIGRTTFKIGSFGFIVIGLLHSYVQYTDLSADKVQGDLKAVGVVDGIGAEAWDLWAGMGFLMGFFAIALGLSNLAGLKGRIDDYPAAGVSAVNMVMLATITIIGALHLGPMQLVGGPFGIIMFGLALAGSRVPA